MHKKFCSCVHPREAFCACSRVNCYRMKICVLHHIRPNRTMAFCWGVCSVSARVSVSVPRNRSSDRAHLWRQRLRSNLPCDSILAGLPRSSSSWLVGFRPEAGCPSFVDQAGTTDLLLYRNHFFDLVIPASARRLPSGIRWPFRESAKSMIAS